MDEMNKTDNTGKSNGVNKKLIAALAALAVLVIAAVVMRSSPPKALPDLFTSPEMAFPKMEDTSHYILMKFEDPQVTKGKIDAMVKIIPALADEEIFSALERFDDFNKGLAEVMGELESASEFAKKGGMRIALGVLDGAAEFLDMTRQSAVLLAVSDDRAEVFVSFFPDGEKFDAYVERALDAGEIKKWETDRAGSKGGAWMFPFGKGLAAGDGLFALRTGGADDVVLLSDTEQGIDRMLDAVGKSASRMDIKRFNDASDYIQVKIPIPVLDTGEEKPSFSELAWVDGDRSVHMQIHSDMFSVMTGRSVPKSGMEGKNIPILGRGELASVIAIDLPYACFSAFPTEADPVGKVISLFADEIPSMYVNDIRTIMEQGRISAVVVADPAIGEPSTAYLIIETKAREVIDRYYGMASFFMQKTDLPGWDSAFSLSVGLGVDPIVARRGDIVLVGIGKPADYAVNASIPEGVSGLATPSDLMSFVATSALLKATGSSLGRTLQEEMIGEGIPLSVIQALGLDELEAVQMRIMTPEKANLGLYRNRSSD